MGCNTSRLDRLPAVALCRDRCQFLEEALRQSYALADAHVVHMESLKTLGPALHSFFNEIQNEDPSDADGSADHSHNPPLNNPDSQPAKSPSPPAGSSFSSDSGSQIQLHFDESEAEDTEKDFNRSRYDYLNHHTVSSAPDNVVFMNYVQPMYAPFSPPPPNSSGYSGAKPPSPPPPSSSGWDFLNFFETFEKYQVPYSPSRDVKEEEEKKKEKEKEKEQNNKNAGDGAVDGSKCDQSNVNKEQDGQGKNTTEGDSKSAGSKNTINMASAKSIRFGDSILELLDVGKLRYHRKIAVSQVSCKMMHVFTPSVSSESSSLLGRRMGSSHPGVDKDSGLSYGNLSSTLKKLCMWEKKLYDEVKSEEKLRILHEKKCRQLRRMKRKGADSHKIDSVQTFIGILSTKMKISIQVVDKLSNTITKMREEELWPQINQFILRFLGIWKDMLECYRCQYQAIGEARCSDASSFNRKLSITHLDTTIELKAEIQKWNLSLSDWIYAHKSYVKALNGWLLRCLLYEPEEISDDTAPFSPGRIGAPPVFVICNKWSRAVDKLSEKDVIEALNKFMSGLNEILEKQILDLQQKLTVDKELERKVKNLERLEQKMHKVVQARERKMVSINKEETDALLSGDAVKLQHGEFTDGVNLQSSLKHIFAAMERFTANAAGAYEELYQHSVLGEFDSRH
ncbi:hypothetical protein L6164_015206 [Bauhinia variegata]|uniref:Uncharacterized protein n=1 Tax=Bauhinia variegata TaxID=167791 RepID=A0ACB9NLL8_BAUVA|nr:hypothetical protein L6164_015206 [Bauhinia variegata]